MAKSALQLWREKLEYFRQQEAVTADAEQKFAVLKKIQEAEDKIAELEGRGAPEGEPDPPWKANPFAVSKLPRTGEYLVGREDELAILDEAWAGAETSIVQIVAPGGVGKTQLVKKWQEGLLDREEHGGVGRAFDWSFYSQGTKQQASADDFFDRALRWFGEGRPEDYKDPWLKGDRLAELVRQRPTLLILDGLEPLQHPPGPMGGELTDPSIQALLEGLQRDNPGLCVVTTREAVRTLEEMGEPKRRTIDLDHLSPEAGAELLERYGVTGDREELRQAADEVEGHALALILLGTYLKQRCQGDVARRSEALLFKGHERYAEHAHKVMASYETWLEREDDTGRAAVAILRLMGLFNRPADAGCLHELRKAPPIPGLTEALFTSKQVKKSRGASDDVVFEPNDERWNRAVERLRAARLLADDDSSNLQSPISNLQSLDAHPFVREHFAAQLDERFPDAAREAHRRLYEHLKQSAPELPDNLKDMMPLYHAVAHGCKAGLWQNALVDAFWLRIRRGNEAFSLRKLGAFTTDLGAIACFFDPPWRKPIAGIRQAAQGWVLAEAGFALRALGRLDEVSPVFENRIGIAVALEDWPNAARTTSNLSELWLTLGDVSAAVRQGEQSVELADRSGDAFQRMSKRTTLADALKAAGRGLAGRRRHEAALGAFHEAEAMQKERQPLYPLLYSGQGYQYCDLLLDELSAISFQPSARKDVESALERIREVRNRAEATLRWYRDDQSIGTLDYALDQLTLGRTYLLKARLIQKTSVERQETEERAALDSCLSALDCAEEHLKESVSLLRQSGQQDDLPRGLLHRAALWRVKYQITKEKSQVDLAERDLGEAERIAKRGSMLIWQIEAALERTRLALALGDKKRAKEKLDETRELIRQTDKPYQPHKPDWGKWQPPEYVGVFKEGEVVGYHCRSREIEWLGEVIEGGEPPL